MAETDCSTAVIRTSAIILKRSLPLHGVSSHPVPNEAHISEALNACIWRAS